MDGEETESRGAKLLAKVRGILEEALALKAALTRESEDTADREEKEQPPPTP
ncbi:hypothetical protein HK107_03725 [Parvularcula sp. ZS-1/3]|uniref:Uncharacterized protein n=1 Tax=Parvularcula mediterranea TaxID=2732508 RepID=A0A7Y3RKQ5_9PROT|nr:hypothetical protein [Parvularcula mediterranea]NNU15435.1 hypothetical protein [Parvularcula mediterranea]